MNEKEIWKYCWDKKVYYSRPLDRDFIWITQENFEPIKKYLIKEFNFVHSGESFRSYGLFSHIHIVDQGDYIFVHKDTGNLARFFPLGLIHLILDVIPYFIFSFKKRVKLESVFERPEEKEIAPITR